VPAAIIREMDLDVGDTVVWRIEERGSEKVAIMKKIEVKGNDG